MFGGAPRKLTQVGIGLRLQELPHQLRELLVHRDHPGATRPPHAVDRRVALELVYPHAIERETTQELDGVPDISLVLRDHVRVRRIGGVLRDRVPPRLITIPEQILPISHGVFEHRHRSGEHVVHRVLEPPPTPRPRTRVERLGAQGAILGGEVAQRVEVRCRVAVERRLGPEGGDVLEHRQVVHVARVPGVEAGAHMRGAGFPFGLELLGDQHPDGVHLARHQRVHPQADRLGEGGQPDPSREGRRLMVYVDDLRLPLPPRACDHARLDHVQHIAVAVVVVPDVLLVELVQRAHLVRGANVLPVPVGDDLLPVGIDTRPEEDHRVVKDRLRARLVGLAQQVIRELDRVLRPRDLARVESAADVDEDLPLASQRARFGAGEPGGMREPLRDLTQPRQVREILARRDDGERPVTAGRRLADLDQADAVTRLRESLEVADRLVVGRELVVRADGETKHRLGRRERRPLRRH